MTKFIQGINPYSKSVGSFSYDLMCSHDDLSSTFFSDHRGSTDQFLAQVPDSISRSNICIARFVAVPRASQRQGWGRKLFRGLHNSLINEGATLAFLEVDPFIMWPENDEFYTKEIEWRTHLYESEGWTPLDNHSHKHEVLRIFMYSNPTIIGFKNAGELVFSEIDEATHRLHQSESDNEYNDD